MKNKLKLLVCALLESIPNRLRKHLHPNLRTSIRRLASRMASSCIIHIDGIKYVLVDAESVLILSRLSEMWMPTYFKVKRGQTFLDVGAHVGKYSFQVAKSVKDSLVISVEADPENYQALRKGVELNHFKNVIPLNVAAWKENRKMKLYIGEKAGWHSLKRDSNLGHAIVQAKRLDDVLKEVDIKKVDWIKIDAEYAELEVLEGLELTLSQHKPNIILESVGEDQGKAVGFLERLEYKVEEINPGNFFGHSLKR